jgi:pyruvate kinase
MIRDRRAKITATLGPASSDPQTIRRLFEAGVDVFRLNFSHGGHADHKARHDAIRALERESGRPIAILQDLQGPKIRLGTLAGARALERGDRVRFVHAAESKAPKELGLPHKEVFEAVMPGHRLLIDDGKVRLVTESVGDGTIEATVTVGGAVTDRKGVNLPDTMLSLSPITGKDRRDLEFGLELGVDWVAFSFIQKPSDVIEALALVDGRAGVMSKIEKPAALQSISDIVRLSDAVMAARGDLGVELPPEDVPAIQKDLVRLCRLAGKPVIVATQMLESMIHTPTPTRAEASDIATAIYDGVDSVMLSAESASGSYPVEAVETMHKVIARTEQHEAYGQLLHALRLDMPNDPQHAVGAAAAELAERLHARAIVAFTSRGTTAYRIARNRPEHPIVGVTPNVETARRLALLWGCHSMTSPDIHSHEEMVDQAHVHMREAGIGAPGDTVIIVAGVPFGQAGSTNILRIVTL